VSSARNPAIILTLSAFCAGYFLTMGLAGYHDPNPPMIASMQSSETHLSDVLGVALGLRHAAADIAWIETLQYYGTREFDMPEFVSINGGGRYSRFLRLCQRVARIDPFFTYIYYFGGSSLGWNLNRPTEAEILIRQGIAANPHEWRLPQYLAAMAYQRNHNVVGLEHFLEILVQDPQTPLIVKGLLANIYKKQGEYDKAIQMWEWIYASGNPEYMYRAIGQIKDIVKLKKGHKPANRTGRLDK
jgi:tetratricopeptide (TPR) repeat protein